MSNLLRKILFAGDFHKKATDPPSIVGYTKVQRSIHHDLSNLISERGCDTLIELGDWYDRGYVDNSAAALSDVDFDISLNKKLNGEFYGLIGNHLRIRMDNNPELYLIQPHPYLTSRLPIARQEQIIKTPDKLKFGTVQISFLHFNHNRKSLDGYKPERDPDTMYHIALYHTPMIIPNQQLMSIGMNVNRHSTTAIGECLKGVDLAICGDIHKPLGQFVVNHQYGNTNMIVPGSLMNTTAAVDDRHLVVSLPIISIFDDGAVKLEFARLDLKTNLLQFKLTGKAKVKKDLDGTKVTKKDRELAGEGDLLGVFDRSVPDAFSLNNLIIRKGYSEEDIMAIKAINASPFDVQRVVDIYTSLPEEL